MNFGLWNHLKPASRPSMARVAATAVISETIGADQQHQREALDAGRRDREQDQRGDRGDDVRVDDRAEALRVAVCDRGAHGLPGAHFFLDAFEDDDVRVGGDADREDQAGEARQRERDAEAAGSRRT